MTTTVVSTIGSTGTYSTLQAWEDAAPTNLTTNRASTTVAGSTSSTIMLDALASSTTDFYVGHPVWANARPSEIRLITAYDGTTKVATIGAYAGSPATWTNVPSIEAYTIDGVIWQGQVQNQAFTSATTLLTISGSTADATRYKELTTAAGASFRDNANKATNALRFNSANGASLSCSGYASANSAINVSEAYVRISNLMLQSTGANSTALCSANSGTLIINNIIAEGLGSGGVICLFGSGQLIRNSVINSRRSSTSGSIANIQAGATAVNCTFVSSVATLASALAATGGYAAPVLKNCAFFGVAAVQSTGTVGSFTTCYTDAASPPSGCTTVTNNTTTGSGFVSITDSTRDYRLGSGSALINVGTTDSGNAATDIIGTARPSGASYDVGAWEYVAAASGLATATSSLSTVTAALTTGIALAATPAAISTATSALSTGISLNGSSAAAASATSALSTGISLASTLAAVATATAALTASGTGMSVTVASAAVVTAALTTGINLAATSTAVSTVAAALANSIRFAATPAAVGTETAELHTGIVLATAPVCSASVIVDLTAPGNIGAWASAQVSAVVVTAMLTTQIRIASSQASVASKTAALTTNVLLGANPVGVSSSTAALLTQIKLLASAQIQSDLIASFSTHSVLSGTQYPLEGMSLTYPLEGMSLTYPLQ